jgi:hypothetical protein
VNHLPPNWTETRLGEVLQALLDFRGRTPKKIGMVWGGGDIPALSALNVRMGSIDFSRTSHFGSQALYERWMTTGDPARGDIVLTMEAPLGNVAQIPDDRRYILSQRVVLLKPNGSIDPTFLAYQMRAPDFRTELLANATVPQDPNDEPAAVLLERIRAAREATPPKPRRNQSARRTPMTKLTTESVRTIIQQMPKDRFSFDDLRQLVTGDYDVLKDILFTLLAESQPSLRQVFDVDVQAMRFQWAES